MLVLGFVANAGVSSMNVIVLVCSLYTNLVHLPGLELQMLNAFCNDETVNEQTDLPFDPHVLIELEDS